MAKATAKKISVIVFALVALFGMGSWIGVNALWLELPLTVQVLPEGWNLPSFLAVVIQIANIAPITVTILNTTVPGKVKETPMIYAIFGVQIAAVFLLAAFWDRTTTVAGNLYSTALLILAFFIAMCNATSNVEFLPYMAKFRPEYMTALFVGMGISGLMPSVIALIQSTGGAPDCINATVAIMINTSVNTTSYVIEPHYPPPLFSVKIFYFIMGLLLCVSCVSFTFMNCLPLVKQYHVKKVVIEHLHQEPPASHQASSSSSDSDRYVREALVKTVKEECGDLEHHVEHPPKLSKPAYALIFVIQAYVCALAHGILVSVQSYSCLPYGNRAFHLSVCLSNIANPIACFLPLWIPTKTVKWLVILTVIASVGSAYIMVLALMSPEPFLKDSAFGEFLVVLAWILVISLLSYVKVTVAGLMREESKTALFWCGVVTQAGSTIGAAIMFPLVNVSQLFVSAPPCPN